MSLLRPVTPAEAEWTTLPNPSARRVTRALSQAGRRVHHSTIARWYARGWRRIRRIRPRLLVTHSMSPAAY
jgi:hypothetical protein